MRKILTDNFEYGFFDLLSGIGSLTITAFGPCRAVIAAIYRPVIALAIYPLLRMICSDKFVSAMCTIEQTREQRRTEDHPP